MASWEFIYGEDLIASGLSLDQVEIVSRRITAQLQQNTVAWFDYDFPLGDGIGRHRLFLTLGVPIHFKQVA